MRRGEYRKHKNLVFLKVFDAGHILSHDQPESG